MPKYCWRSTHCYKRYCIHFCHLDPEFLYTNNVSWFGICHSQVNRQYSGGLLYLFEENSHFQPNKPLRGEMEDEIKCFFNPILWPNFLQSGRVSFANPRLNNFLANWHLVKVTDSPSELIPSIMANNINSYKIRKLWSLKFNIIIDILTFITVNWLTTNWINNDHTHRILHSLNTMILFTIYSHISIDWKLMAFMLK